MFISKILLNKLVDTFGRSHTYLRISITERCNLRCQYCMPAEGIDLTPTPQLLTVDEIHRVAKLFVSLGINKIRVTGGEPLVHPKVEDICSKLSKIDGLNTLSMTTNGILLTKKMENLVKAGLTSVNISLDTLHEEKFAFIARRNGLQKVLQSIDSAVEHGIHTKVNCVVMKGFNDDELNDFVQMTKTKPISVRFIEFMPFDDNQWNNDKFVSYQAMLHKIRSKFPKLESIGQDIHDTAKLWHVPGHVGTVGFITSMTEHFCGGCNRLRLTADGHVKVCLFGGTEVNLKSAINEGKSDEDLTQMILGAVLRKKAAHAGYSSPEELAKSRNRAMIKIGG